MLRRREQTRSAPSAPTSDSAVERLIYEESRRALDLQLGSLDALRSRAGTVLAAAALVTTFLGGAALANGRSAAGWGSVGIGAFIVCAVLTMVVLFPMKFHFAFDPEKLVTDWVDVTPRSDPCVVLRDLALHYAQAHRNNLWRVKLGQWAFRLATAALAAEVVAWLLELGRRI